MLRRAGDRAAPGSDLGTARFETFLRRLFSVKGIVAPAIDPKISAGIELLTTPWELAENALVAGWRGYTGWAYVAAGGAGLYGCIELRPAPSVVAVVPWVDLRADAAQTVAVGIRDSRPTGMAASTHFGALDSRYGSIASVGAAPACRIFQGSNNTATGLIPHVVAVAGAGPNYRIYGPWVLTFANTSATFQILNLVANVAFEATVCWYERALEPSEAAAR